MVVANKCDGEAQRVVTLEEGRAFADRHGLYYSEMSAEQAASTHRKLCERVPSGLGGAQQRLARRRHGPNYERGEEINLLDTVT